MSKNIIVAIDGPAGAGKSTTAKRVAESLGYTYIDSGAMYRAVTLAAIRSHQDVTVELLDDVLPKIRIELQPRADGQRTLLNDEDVSEQIRSSEVTNWVSPVSTMPHVRTALVKMQRSLGEGGGVVMDGRDIGTVVFPHAEIKVFLVADTEERIRRRTLEMQQKGIFTTSEDVRRQIIERDRIDSTRLESPLTKADGAVEIDTTGLTVDEQVAMILDLVGKYQRTYNLISNYGGI